MSSKRWAAWVAVLVVLVLALAACGGDEDGASGSSSNQPSATPAAGMGGGLAMNPPALGVAPGGAVSSMPGCSDPNDDECPAALDLPLGGLASAGGVALNYPNTLFKATITSRAADGVLIRIEPSEANKYAELATFEVYFADSIDAALAVLTEPEVVEWAAPSLTGKVGVSRDQTSDPPVATTIGALSLADGRTVVLKATTTGKYGWDLWHRVYEGMLNSLQVTS